MKGNCSVCGKEGKIIKGMCTRHYQQMRRYGYIPERTERTPNNITKVGDYAEVDLYSKGKVVAKVKISQSDIEKVSKLKWSLDRSYARNAKTKVLMHRYITDAPDWKFVDHINGDRLDNRRENLRVVNPFINGVNKTKTMKRGIDMRGSRFKKYRARIGKDNKQYHLGNFATYEEALEARKKAELDLYGELFE
jgi:hypothetical protein